MLRIFWLYYILFIVITITFSYIISYIRSTKITAPVGLSASAQSAEGRRTPRHNIGAVTAVMAVMADALLKDTPLNKTAQDAIQRAMRTSNIIIVYV